MSCGVRFAVSADESLTKLFSWKKLPKDSPVAFAGEAGYQADLSDARLALEIVLLYA